MIFVLRLHLMMELLRLLTLLRLIQATPLLHLNLMMPSLVFYPMMPWLCLHLTVTLLPWPWDLAAAAFASSGEFCLLDYSWPFPDVLQQPHPMPALAEAS